MSAWRNRSGGHRSCADGGLHLKESARLRMSEFATLYRFGSIMYHCTVHSARAAATLNRRPRENDVKARAAAGCQQEIVDRLNCACIRSIKRQPVLYVHATNQQRIVQVQLSPTSMTRKAGTGTGEINCRSWLSARCSNITPNKARHYKCYTKKTSSRNEYCTNRIAE